MNHKGHILYLYETATGLGHQRRASGIVNQLFEDGFEVTVASGSFVKPEEYFHSGINLIRLPTNRKNVGGKFHYYDEHNNLVLDEKFDLNSWKAERKKAIEDIASHKKIDALIPEWWPFKRINEFSGVVQQIEESQERHFGQKPLIFSSIRDVLSRIDLDEPDNDNAQARRAVEILNNRVTAVLVHGDPHLVTFPETFALADDIKIPLFYTGYVVRDADRPAGSDGRSKKVIISSGSGDLGHHVLNAAHSARGRTDIALHNWTYVLGPRIGESRDKLHCLKEVFTPPANGLYQVPQDECIEDTSDLPQWFRHAAFSISNAGYNTTMEVLSSGVPAVLTAKTKRDGDFDKEQWSRLLRLKAAVWPPSPIPTKHVTQKFLQKLSTAPSKPDRRQ